jgi:hypothetical protein
LPLLNKKRKLVMSFSNVDPQSSGSNLLTLLRQHTPMINPRSICVNRQALTTLRQGQNRSIHHFILKSLKTNLTLITPFKSDSFLCKSSQRLCNNREILHKTSIIASKTQETMNVSHIRRYLPLNYGSNILRIDQNVMLINKMTQKRHF